MHLFYREIETHTSEILKDEPYEYIQINKSWNKKIKDKRQRKFSNEFLNWIQIKMADPNPNHENNPYLKMKTLMYSNSNQSDSPTKELKRTALITPKLNTLAAPPKAEFLAGAGTGAVNPPAESGESAVGVGGARWWWLCVRARTTTMSFWPFWQRSASPEMK